MCSKLLTDVLAIILVVLHNYADAKLTLENVPSPFYSIKNNSLTIQCQYQPDGNSSSKAVQSLTLSKVYKSVGSEEQMYTIRRKNPRTPVRFIDSQDFHISATDGLISNGTEKSYLKISWNNAAAKDAGFYACIADFDDLTFEELELEVVDESLQLLEERVTNLEKNNNASKKESARKKECKSRENSLEHRLGSQLNFHRSKETNGRVYLLTSNVMVDFDEALIVCRSAGGYLLEIDDSKEFQFILKFLKEEKIINITDSILIGGKRNMETNEWYWTHSNKKLLYQPWGHGEPSLMSNDQCIDFLYRGGLWYINDTICAPSIRAMCEVPLE